MQQSLVDELRLLDDAHERLALVVDRARHATRLAPEERTPDHQVRGCTSAVWLVARHHAGRCHFRVDADSPLVHGLVLFVTDYFNNSTPAEILTTPTDPLTQLGLTKNLSPTRRNGLAAVHAAITAFAQAQQT